MFRRLCQCWHDFATSLLDNSLSVVHISACSSFNQVAFISPVLNYRRLKALPTISGKSTGGDSRTCLLNCLSDVWSCGRCQEKQQGAQRHHMQFGSRGLLCRCPPPFIPEMFQPAVFQMMMIVVMEAFENEKNPFWIFLFFNYFQVQTWKRELRCNKVKLGLLCPKQDLSSLS